MANNPNKSKEHDVSISCLLTLEGDSDIVKSLAILEDSQIIVSDSNYKTLKVWDFKTGQVVHTQKEDYDTDNYEFVILSPDRPKLLICSHREQNHTTVLWDWHTEEAIYTSQRNTFSLEYEWDHEHLYLPRIKSLEISPGGKTIVINYDYEEINYGTAVCSFSEVVNLETGYSIACNNHSHDVCWVISLNDEVIVSEAEDNSVLVWKETYNSRDWIKEQIDEDENEDEEKFSNYNTLEPGEEVDTDAIMAEKDFDTVRVCRALEGHSAKVTSLAVSDDGQTIISGSNDKTIKVWNWQTGEIMHTLKGHSARVTSLAVSDDGQTIVSGSSDATIKLWDLQTGKVIHTIEPI